MASSDGARRLAQAMAFVAGLGVVFIPIAETASWALMARTTRLSPEQVADDVTSNILSQAASGWGVALADPAAVTTPALVAGWLIALLGSAPVMVGLWNVRRTFLESAEGRPFSDASVRSFRRFAWASLIAVIAVIVERSATGVAITSLSPDLQNQLSVGLGSEDFSRLFSALLLVAVAHMFADAKRLAEDVEGLL